MRESACVCVCVCVCIESGFLCVCACVSECEESEFKFVCVSYPFTYICKASNLPCHDFLPR